MAKDYKTMINDVLKTDLFGPLEKTGAFDMPIIQSYEVAIPEKLVPFTSMNTSSSEGTCIHFFCYDYTFQNVFKSPSKYVDKLKSFSSVIFPDFSQYANMPYFQRLYNSAVNKAIGSYWQKQGVTIIANVTWSKPDSFEYCFDGIPKNCMIAISSMGAKKSSLSKYLWRLGYEEALERLQPKWILRYGEIMPGEKEEISSYYECEHLKRMRNGSKW